MKSQDRIRIKPGVLVSPSVIEDFPDIREAVFIVILVLQDDVLAALLSSNPVSVIFRFTKDQLEKIEQ